ncbi:MAG: DUF1992 domain-containing protein [Gammaproteobacteria bacterium]
MWLLDQLAEKHITEAQQRGELDGLAGEGKPLRFDDEAIVAPELRAAYRLLKNAGYVPPAVQLRREIADAEMLLSEARGVEARGAASKRLRYLLTRLAAADLRLQQDYYDKLVERLGPRGAHPHD